MHHLIYGLLAAFSFLHIYRDYQQIKYGYNHSWFTRVGHVWNAPKYEKPGMVVFAGLGIIFLVLAFS